MASRICSRLGGVNSALPVVASCFAEVSFAKTLLALKSRGYSRLFLSTICHA